MGKLLIKSNPEGQYIRKCVFHIVEAVSSRQKIVGKRIESFYCDVLTKPYLPRIISALERKGCQCTQKGRYLQVTLEEVEDAP